MNRWMHVLKSACGEGFVSRFVGLCVLDGTPGMSCFHCPCCLLAPSTARRNVLVFSF
jgi:hypothetical protein